VQVLAKSTAYTKRNVQEAVTSLTAAGVLFSFEVGNEQVFSIPRDRWAQFLELDQLPTQQDWPQLFAVYRRVLRWLADPAREGLSDYMLSSEMRTLAEEAAPDLRYAGIRTGPAGNDFSYFEWFGRELLDSVPT
jgi:hypothetical protein